tara:strand:- start:55740 stop:56537 length:798 start_codon:yes stop_codon:yes gene_type:complete
MQKKITSPQNYLIKRFLSLKDKPKLRKKLGLFVIEGEREIRTAINNGYQIINILFTPEIFDSKKFELISKKKINLVLITKKIYSKIAHRSNSEGVIALAKMKSHSLENLIFKNQKPLIVVAESIEKPGNIGAMVRTCEAANVDAFLIADPKTDLYNPNIVRNSLGGIFSIQIGIESSKNIIEYLNNKKISIFTTTLKNSSPYTKLDYKDSTALVFGNESNGVSVKWEDSSIKEIKIPMLGELDSMNVSVATGIIVFEAVRQRNFI